MSRKKISLEKQKEYQERYHSKYPNKKAEFNRDWIKNNKERYNASKFHYRNRLKQDIINHYSNGTMSCNYCGYKDIRALCLDHINNDGATWRKKHKVSGRSTSRSNTYQVIKKLNNPEGLQVLCANCNLIKEIELKEAKRNNNIWYKNENNNIAA